MANFYVELAERILGIAQRPLSAREIMQIAQEGKLIPEKYTRARTPIKTIHARIAESIRRNGSKSPFYRFARGKFGLRANLNNLTYQRHFAKEYKAKIRRKEISNEDVLCIARTALPIDNESGFFSVSAFNQFVEHNEALKYVPRKEAEKDFSLKQIVTYVAILKDQHVLCYERGNYSATGAELIGRKSIGFGGHIDANDVNLFSSDRYGIISNAWRELQEELRLTDKHISSEGPLVVGLINDNSTIEGQKHLAIAMIVRCRAGRDFTKGELEIRNLHWKTAIVLPNDLSSFEVWSKIFYERIVNGWDNIG